MVVEEARGLLAVVAYFPQIERSAIEGQLAELGLPYDPVREEQLLGGAPSERPELSARTNPITYLDPYDPPTLLVHGDGDALVPHAQSERFLDALQRVGVPGGYREGSIPSGGPDTAISARTLVPGRWRSLSSGGTSRDDREPGAPEFFDAPSPLDGHSGIVGRPK